MSKKMSPDLRRTRVLSVRMHESEVDTIRARAIASGMSPGTYLRHCILVMPLPPLPAIPKVPYETLQRLQLIHEHLTALHQQIYGFIAQIRNDRYVRLNKERTEELFQDLADRTAAVESIVQCAVAVGTEH